MRRALVTGALGLSLFTACATTQPPSPMPVRTIVGATGGAAAGGLLGGALSRGNPLITTAGGLLGGLVGAGVGQVLDLSAKPDLDAAARTALGAPTGSVIPFQSPNNGPQGTITPGVWSMRGPSTCRTFVAHVTIEGQTQTITGCVRQRTDGTMEVMR